MQPLTPSQVYSNANTSRQVLVFDAEAIFNAIGLSLKLEDLNIIDPWLMLNPKYVLM
jgi:hypothetical protein